MRQIIGIGTGELDSLTLAAYQAVLEAGNVILQTVEIPLAEALTEKGVRFQTLDGFYEEAEDFADFHERVCEFLAGQEGAVLCVMGGVYENTLAQAVLAQFGPQTRVIPGLSFGEEALSRCAGRLTGGPARFYTGTEFREARYQAESPVVITEVDTPYKAADAALKLMEWLPEEQEIYLVRGAEVEAMPLAALLRRQEGWDYRASVVADKPVLLKKQSYSFYDLVDIIAALRSENGCPWDRAQTHESLRKTMIEEAYEVVDAIDAADPYMLEEELGDVLLQAVLHAQIGDEFSEFSMDGVTTGICRKMIHRHAHIFGTDICDTPEEVLTNWEKIKREEKGQQSVSEAMEAVPKGMSPLMRAAKIQKKAANTGFDFPDWKGAYEKVREELEEAVRELPGGGETLEKEAGDLLFAVVNLLRLWKVDGDTALNQATKKFMARFARMEELAREKGLDLEKMPIESQENLYQKAKSLEKFCKQ